MRKWEYRVEDLSNRTRAQTTTLISTSNAVKEEKRQETLEYMLTRSMETKLETLGSEGWELVTATYFGGSDSWRCIFKRQMGDDPRPEVVSIAHGRWE